MQCIGSCVSETTFVPDLAVHVAQSQQLCTYVLVCIARSIMVYRSTPYVGMAPPKKWWPH